MLEFRWVAPVAFDLATAPGVRDRLEQEDQAFWGRVAKRWNEKGWQFSRASSSAQTIRYTRAAGDALPRPLELVDAEVDLADLPDALVPGRAVEATEDVPAPEPTSDLIPTALRWTLFDHGVAMAEGRLRYDGELRGDLGSLSQHLEAEVQAVGEQLSRWCLDEHIGPLAKDILATSGADVHVLTTDPAGERPSDGGSDVREEAAEENRGHGPLWVSRALSLTEQTGHIPSTGIREFTTAWLAGTDGDVPRLVDELLDGQRANVTSWMNYVYRETDPAADVLWEALRRAQYFYTAATEVDARLRTILSWSMAPRSEVSLTALRDELEGAVNQAQELLLVRAEVGRYGSRIGRTEMRRVLDAWDHDEILDGPIREKLQICRERLESLAADRAARSAMFTDIILMTIGVTSVLATAIALVQFGRQASADPGQSAFDFGHSTITYWLSAQSIDAIVLVSVIISVVLISVFIWKRRQSVS